MGAAHAEKRCWITLVTKATYLPGVIILAHSLDVHKSDESFHKRSNCSCHVKAKKTPVLLQNASKTHSRSYEHSKLTSTVSREHVSWMLICSFSKIVCVCNLDSDEWAPDDWQKENCVYTLLVDPDQVATDISSRPTYRALNGGLFIFDASDDLWQRLLSSFNSWKCLKDYQFPDQDFLADFYKDEWQPVSWKYNALKTWRYVHPRLWSDDKVAILHYIVDKPWESRVDATGVAGYLGRDGTTHQWWWNVYQTWLELYPQDSPTLQTLVKLVDNEKSVAKTTPLPQKPGTPEDVKDYTKVTDRSVVLKGAWEYVRPLASACIIM